MRFLHFGVCVVGMVVAGCGGAPARSPSSPTSAAVSEASEAPATEAPTVSVAVPLGEAPTGDLSSCPLAPTVHELGDAHDGEPSTPIPVPGGFLVAFTRARADGTGNDLWVQRAGLDGTLGSALAVRSDVHGSRPIVAGAEGRAYVVAIASGGSSEVLELDPETGAALSLPIPLSDPPEDLAMGARGRVLTHTDGAHRVLLRDAEPEARVPGPSSWPDPRELILASGPAADVVLVRHGARVGLAVVGASPVVQHLFSGRSPIWAEASVAAGPSGFVVVRNGPGIGDLEVHLADASGVAANAPVVIPMPTGTRAPDAVVRRYPRAAALGSGWVLSYWDGTGPSIVRLDAAGAVTAEALEVRSGDERGGHTDGRMATTEGAIAITWQVLPPRMDHGFPEEQPRREGPRLAILRCL